MFFLGYIDVASRTFKDDVAYDQEYMDMLTRLKDDALWMCRYDEDNHNQRVDVYTTLAVVRQQWNRLCTDNCLDGGDMFFNNVGHAVQISPEAFLIVCCMHRAHYLARLIVLSVWYGYITISPDVDPHLQECMLDAFAEVDTRDGYIHRQPIHVSGTLGGDNYISAGVKTLIAIRVSHLPPEDWLRAAVVFRTATGAKKCRTLADFCELTFPTNIENTLDSRICFVNEMFRIINYAYYAIRHVSPIFAEDCYGLYNTCRIDRSSLVFRRLYRWLGAAYEHILDSMVVFQTVESRGLLYLLKRLLETGCHWDKWILLITSFLHIGNRYFRHLECTVHIFYNLLRLEHVITMSDYVDDSVSITRCYENEHVRGILSEMDLDVYRHFLVHIGCSYSRLVRFVRNIQENAPYVACVLVLVANDSARDDTFHRLLFVTLRRFAESSLSRMGVTYPRRNMSAIVQSLRYPMKFYMFLESYHQKCTMLMTRMLFEHRLNFFCEISKYAQFLIERYPDVFLDEDFLYKVRNDTIVRQTPNQVVFKMMYATLWAKERHGFLQKTDEYCLNMKLHDVMNMYIREILQELLIAMTNLRRVHFDSTTPTVEASQRGQLEDLWETCRMIPQHILAFPALFPSLVQEHRRIIDQILEEEQRKVCGISQYTHTLAAEFRKCLGAHTN